MTRAWYDLSGKVALVIGASKGLGRESALALAEAGADVACAARSRDALVAVAGAIKEKGHRSFFTVADVTAEESIRNGVGAVTDHFGRIDILVYSAGTMHAAPALQTTKADWDRVLTTNLTGAFLVAREVASTMKEQGGRIVIFGTTFVGRALPLTVAYNASKGGLHQLVQTLAVEWARYRITVNGIAPGYFETDMPKAVLEDPELRQRVLSRIPLRRFGNPPEIGPLVNYLASDASGFMTGSILRIDGGQALNVS